MIDRWRSGRAPLAASWPAACDTWAITTITYHLNVSVLEDAMRALMDAFKLNVSAKGDRP
ncbi:MAG TPA: hypothetical protein VFH63_08310 [candidate division Zixibacteria bacterium]|nr:hypothetical protein [candidate division Zixibacteria bacterium]